MSRYNVSFIKLAPAANGRWKPRTIATVEVEAESQDGAFVMAEKIAQSDPKLNEAHTFRVRLIS